MSLILKRVYEAPSPQDGYRLLVDRLWPRGVSKERAALDEWNKDIAPSNELRKWFGHQPELFEEFAKRYKEELKAHATVLNRIKKRAKKEPVCILYGAKDETHNQAVVLKKVLETL